MVPGQLAGLDLRHRQHARVEDRQAKATGLRNLPCHSFDANAAWLQIPMTATAHPDTTVGRSTTPNHQNSRPTAPLTQHALRVAIASARTSTATSPRPHPSEAGFDEIYLSQIGGREVNSELAGFFRCYRDEDLPCDNVQVAVQG